MDSRRFIATTQGDSVDLNFIPSNLIQRTEVVTGGASAAYGSGAISGVVNVMLDKRLDGIKAEADYGATTHGDGKNWHMGLAGGTDFAGTRGHIVAGVEYQKQDAIQSCADARDWCRNAVGFYRNNPGFSFTPGAPYTGAKIPGQPDYLITAGLRENQLSSTGVIFNGAPNATSTFQFNAAGTDIVPFTIGATGWVAPGGQVVGGSGDLAYTNLSLFPEVERKTFFSHADYEITDNLSAYLELSYGEVEGVNHQWGSGQNRTDICIRADNAYLGTLTTAARNAGARRGEQQRLHELLQWRLPRRHHHQQELESAERPDGHDRHEGVARRPRLQRQVLRHLDVGRVLPVRQDEARPDRRGLPHQLALHDGARLDPRSACRRDVRPARVPRDGHRPRAELLAVRLRAGRRSVADRRLQAAQSVRHGRRVEGRARLCLRCADRARRHPPGRVRVLDHR